MKRLYLTVVALLSMTMTFAGDKNGMDAAGANTAATSATMAKADSKALMDSAVEKDMKYMSYVLTPEQFDKYQTLINTTLANRGLEK